jgi:hypothetical protein
MSDWINILSMCWDAFASGQPDLKAHCLLQEVCFFSRAVPTKM